MDYIPDGWSSDNFYQFLHKWESVIDVYIAGKRSARNTRFEFARFIHQGDMETSRLVKLNGLSLEGFSLKFSVAKYESRDRIPSLATSAGRGRRFIPVVEPPRGHAQDIVVSGKRLFSDVVAGVHSGGLEEDVVTRIMIEASESNKE